jgi:hypothetical protein
MIDQEKVNYVKTIFPKLSERGQKYLQQITEAMLVIQDSALSPVQDEVIDDQCKTTNQNAQ